MSADGDRLDERVAALERALTDGHEFEDLGEAGDLAARVEALDDRIAGLEERIDDLDAAVQAVRGYVGNVRSVNREVERRVDAALAAATDGVDETRVEEALAAHGKGEDDSDGRNGGEGEHPRPREAIERAGTALDLVRDAL